MKSTLSVAATTVAALAAVAPYNAATAYSPSSSFTGMSVSSSASNANSMTMEYIPSGMSKEQWQAMKNKERNANKGKNLGKVGITTFKSRTFQDWQKSGGRNLMPVLNAEEKLRRGEIKPQDVPYMQRPGGRPDDSDLKAGGGGGGLFGMFGGGAKKKEAETKPEPQEKSTNWWTLN